MARGVCSIPTLDYGFSLFGSPGGFDGRPLMPRFMGCDWRLTYLLPLVPGVPMWIFKFSHAHILFTLLLADPA